MPVVDFPLYLITDRHRIPPGTSLTGLVEAALCAGVRAVQLREKDLDTEALLPLARQLRRLTDRYGARLLINGDIDTALAVGADGVHLPSASPPIAEARARLGGGRLVGVSTHSLAEIEQAARNGADFVTFGPVFATPSKARYGEPSGPAALAEACRISPIPVFALGGIIPDRLDELRSAGCHHVACIGAILGAPDPAEAVRRLLS